MPILWPAPTNGNTTNNFVGSYSLGGNQNQNIVRVDQKINDAQHIFGRFSQWNNLNQPEDPEGKGLCLDRCTETFTSKGIAIGYNYVFTRMLSAIWTFRPPASTTFALPRIRASTSHPSVGLPDSIQSWGLRKERRQQWSYRASQMT